MYDARVRRSVLGLHNRKHSISPKRYSVYFRLHRLYVVHPPAYQGKQQFQRKRMLLPNCVEVGVCVCVWVEV